jgi:hypothetical protein
MTAPDADNLPPRTSLNEGIRRVDKIVQIGIY